MTQYTLTANQQDAIERLIDATEKEQDAVATYTASKTAGEARRDSCYTQVENALTELGHTGGLPSPITALTKDLEPDGSWLGEVTVT